jgi:hypothetical protein
MSCIEEDEQLCYTNIMDNNTCDTFAALSSEAKKQFLLDAIQSILDQEHQVVINPLITHLRSHYIDGKFDEQGICS